MSNWTITGDSAISKRVFELGVKKENEGRKEERRESMKEMDEMRVSERRTKRRRSALGPTEEYDKMEYGKRVKYESGGYCKQDGVNGSGVNQSKIAESGVDQSKNLPIAPINLADLRWESYDLHLGPFEYAPVLS